MKYAADIGSSAMICIPSLFRCSKVDVGQFTDTQHSELISILLRLQNKENRLITWRMGECEIIM
jgi:hypothetical protein